MIYIYIYFIMIFKRQRLLRIRLQSSENSSLWMTSQPKTPSTWGAVTLDVKIAWTGPSLRWILYNGIKGWTDQVVYLGGSGSFGLLICDQKLQLFHSIEHIRVSRHLSNSTWIMDRGYHMALFGWVGSWIHSYRSYSHWGSFNVCSEIKINPNKFTKYIHHISSQ